MIRTRHLFLSLGLALAAGIAAPGCVVRGSGYISGTSPVVYQEPPQPQVEQVQQRPGYVWVRGRWDWQNEQWQWLGGRWERERGGYAYADGRWERRGSSWHWVEGQWSASGNAGVDVSNASGGVVVTDSGPRHGGGHHSDPGPGRHTDVSNASGGVVVTDTNPRNTGGGSVSGSVTVTAGGSMYPTVAPPPPRAESVQPRGGYVWVSGRWNWANGNWAWVDGHWEREKANQAWVAGRWELQGNYYVWIDGRWGNR